MTCLETPAGGSTDIDLYSATEGTGVNDTAIGDLTETQIINAGAASAGTMVAGGDIAADRYLYLVSQGTGDATYTAGRFLIEVVGYDVASQLEVNYYGLKGSGSDVTSVYNCCCRRSRWYFDCR